MNIIFLSPHFPPNYHLFCVALKNLGANALGIGDMPHEILGPALQHGLTHYYRVDDLEDYDQLYRACGYYIYHFGRLDRIESHNEHWLLTEAQLRTDFNIPGVKADQMAQMQKKSHMKQTFVAAGIPVARGQVVNTWEELQQLVHAVRYPIVAKPDKGVGAGHTYKIHNADELKSFWANKLAVDYIVEEFIDGSICSFDGLVDRDGQVVFYTAHQNCDGVMEIVTHDLHTAYYSLRKIPQDLEEMGHRAVRAFDLRERFFHIEFFRTYAEGKLVALEANFRPPGGLTMDMFNYANDIDMYTQWARLVVENRFTAHYSREFHCAYISRKLSKHYAFPHKDIVTRYHDYIVHHTPMSAVFRRAMGDYGYLVRSPDLEKILEIKEFIHKVLV